MIKLGNRWQLPARTLARQFNALMYQNKTQTLSNKSEIRAQTLGGNFSFTHYRLKYDKKDKSARNHESDSDDEVDANELSKDKALFKTSVGSLRADLIIKAGLGLARNKVETKFYENKIRVNGKKISKKSIQLGIGDEVDVIKGLSPVNTDHLVVGRVEIVSASPREESVGVVLRRYKSMIVENYPGSDAWKGTDDST